MPGPASLPKYGALPVGRATLAWGSRTYLMGIINATPDSFSGDGIGTDLAAAGRQAADFTAHGADIIDVGGESTRPGHVPVSAADEIARVIPVLRAVRSATTVPISIDTYKPEVAEQALDAGADMVNCIWGAVPGIVEICAARRAPLILMHNQLTTGYAGDCVSEVIRSLVQSAQEALDGGMPVELVIVDPGIGFGKTADQNIQVLARLAEIPAALPYPLLVGPSRKSFIGKITGLDVSQRGFGTAAAVALSVAAGADIVRVHDVAAMRSVVAVADAICRERPVRAERSQQP